MEALKRDSLFSDTLVGDFWHQLEDYYVLSFCETRSMGKLGLVGVQSCTPGSLS